MNLCLSGRGQAQMLFFLALLVAAFLFLNNVTHLSDFTMVDIGDMTMKSLGDTLSLGSTPHAAVDAPAAVEPVVVPPPVLVHVNPSDGQQPPVVNKPPTPVEPEETIVVPSEETEVPLPVPEKVPETVPPPPVVAVANPLAGLTPAEMYAKFEAPVGILAETPWESIVATHAKIDDFDNVQRCRRYGYTYTAALERKRRIFYGAILEDEPWELLEILASESYGTFEAMVFLEPSRDHYAQPRTSLRLAATAVLQQMFGIANIRVIPHVNDDTSITGDLRADTAREDIVKAWKDMGMTVDDVGYMSNIDDIFARDYIRAIQHCELPEMKYDLHHCLHNRVKVFANNQVYETSPECVSRTKKYEHPSMMIGACIEGIGSEENNRLAPRDDTGIYRKAGWNCDDRAVEKDIKDQKYPLWTGADMRTLCGGRQGTLRATMHQQYTGFHFRNFYRSAKDMRLQHTTEDQVYAQSLDDLGEDMRVTYRCIKETPDEQSAVVKRVPGGFSDLKPMTPIYFADANYRAAVHERAKAKILEDDKNVKAPVKKEDDKKKDDAKKKVDGKKKDGEKVTKKKPTTKKN
jgi:hypothetical protein